MARGASQLCLRPFDVGVALHLLLRPDDRYDPMAKALITSTSAVHRAVLRLRRASLCEHDRQVHVDAFCEFVEHGLRYAFPPMRGAKATGVGTACLHPDLAHLAEDSLPCAIWSTKLGNDEGETLVPLFSAAPQVAANDAGMHRLLAACDAARMGSAPQREAAALLIRTWARA